MTVDTPDTALPLRLRAATLHRVTALCGLAYVTLLVLNIAVTTTGPLPNGSVPAEAARMASEGIEVRLSALLGLFGTAAFGGFVVGLALLAVYRGRLAAAAVMAAGGVVHCAVWMVSFAALADSAQAAQTGLPAEATMAMGHLHSTTLLLGFAPAGVVLIASAAAGIWRRIGTIAALLVALAALVAPACVLSIDMDMGPRGAPLVVAFWGIPAWIAAGAITLLRRHPQAAPRVVTAAAHPTT
jgi:hypothetical protein